MSHLASFRPGWENEHLAKFILSKFAFVAHPATISDDIGSDYFCTLFQKVAKGKQKYLIPKNSFAIQIKSNPESFDVTNKLEYLWNVEIPFLVGVVDQNALSLTIYSGESLPIFFSHKGRPRSLKLELCERAEKLDLDDYISPIGENQYTLRFPKLVDIQANIGAEELESKVRVLYELCSLTYDNIASRRNGEYIFKIYGSKPPQVVTFAGKTSAQGFRENFLKRLAEVFYNLKWIHDSKPNSFDEREFEIYEGLYYDLKDLYGNLPAYVSKPFYALKWLREDPPLMPVGSFSGIDPDANNYND